MYCMCASAHGIQKGYGWGGSVIQRMEPDTADGHGTQVFRKSLSVLNCRVIFPAIHRHLKMRLLVVFQKLLSHR